MVSRENSSAYDAHVDVDLLLPWYVNGSLGEAEAELCRMHLDVCLSCRRELANQQKVHFAIRSSDANLRLPQRSFAKLAGRINRTEAEVQVASSESTAGKRLLAQWSDWIMPWISPGFARALPALVLTGVAVLLPGSGGIGSWGTDQGERLYRTLSDAGSDFHGSALHVTDISVALRRGMPAAAIESLANKVQATIVAGPDTLGLYTLRLKNNDVSPTILAELRREDGVLLAEPTISPEIHAGIGGGGQHRQ